MSAKKRLVKYLKLRGVSQYEFSRKTGLSNGFLNSGENVTSANLDAITNVFDDLNLVWIVKGIGPMITPEEIKQLTYVTGDGENTNAILNEEYASWIAGNSDEKLLNMTPGQLIEVNRLLKTLVHSKNETILAKDEKILTLEQIITEKDKQNILQSKLIAQLEQDKTKE